MIKDLNYDYSSWSLRDTAASGKTKDKDPIRLQAEEILTAAISELELLGLPENKPENEKIWELLKDELTGKQIKQIETLVKSDNSDKIEKISDILEEIEVENLALIVANLLTS
jgi:hypothetical protein